MSGGVGERRHEGDDQSRPTNRRASSPAARVDVMTGRAKAPYDPVPRPLIIVDDEDAPGRHTLGRQEAHRAYPARLHRRCQADEPPAMRT